MSIISRIKELSQWNTIEQKRAYLDELNNLLPFKDKHNVGDLEVCIMDKGNYFNSQWKSWFEVRENNWWVKKVNNRLIALPEVVIDLDPEKNESKEEFEKRLKKALDYLKKRGYDFCTFFSGSRGYHIHIIMPDLMRYERDRYMLENIKLLLIKKLGGDHQKSCLRSMIAIAGAPHWKTGKKKRRVQNG